MYAPDVTAARVQLASERLGFQLRYSAQSQIDDAIAHFNDLWDADRQRLKRPLKPGEQQFITNERTLCALDFRGYWLPNYAWIVNWRKEPQRFIPNVAQQIVMDLWAEDEAAGHAIWMQQLKARRLGVSTISELNVCHRYQFQAYSNCVVASADPDKTVEMAGMIKFCLEQQPWWLLPRVTKVKRAIPVEFGDQHSTLAIEAGNQFTGVARGAAPNIIHLSELCEWRGADALIDGALLPAIIDTEDVFGILESTAKGSGWWEDKWIQVKRDWSRGTGRIRPVFLPWYVGTDIYPSPAWLRKTPIPATWIPQERTIRHAEKARAYVLTNPLLFTHVAKGRSDWQMSREQMWFRECMYQTAKEEKKLHIFLAEYCSDDAEAFQVQQNPILDQEIIIAYEERIRDPKGVYTIVGPDIPPQMVAPRRDWDFDKPTITVRTRDLLPNFDATYQFIPLIFHGFDTFDEQLKLLIWEYPTAPHVYGVGVDCSEGVGADNAVIEVLREARPDRECGQVAEWAANTVTAFQLWPLALAVACFYSMPDPDSGERKQSRLAIETWTNGAAAQNECQKRGWANFHPMYYAGDSRRPKRPGEVNRIGVITNQVLRSAIQDMWFTCLKEEAIDIPSRFLVGEIKTLENVEGKAQAALGKHDDRWMGLGFPLLSLHQGKPAGQQYTRRRVSYAPGLDVDVDEQPIWTPGAQSSSDPFGQPKPAVGAQPIFRNRARGALGRYTNPNMPIRFR